MGEEWCDDLAAVVAAAYELAEPVGCRFLRHGFNDHFRVTTGAGELHLRVYLDGKYYIGSDDDFRFELALTDALAAAGCPVAQPVRRRDGGLLTAGEVGGRERRVAMFEVAPGAVNTAPTTEDAAAIGRAVAMVHATIDEVVASLPGARYHLDHRYLIEQPVEQLRRAAGDAPELEAIERTAVELASLLGELPKATSDYGIIHADFHLGNMHFDDARRLTIFDFDHCANGWRAYDFAPIRTSLTDEQWETALTAYAGERALPPGIDRIDDLVRIRSLWDIGDILAMEAVWGNDDASKQVRAALPKICQKIGATTA